MLPFTSHTYHDQTEKKKNVKSSQNLALRPGSRTCKTTNPCQERCDTLAIFTIKFFLFNMGKTLLYELREYIEPDDILHAAGLRTTFPGFES